MQPARRKLVRNRPLRRLTLQELEPRCLLAGNVSVRVDHGSLFLKGDNAANDIEVRVEGTELLVSGRNGTRINGGTTPLRLTSSQVSNHLFANMKGGHDIVEVVGLRLNGKVEIKTRQGNDRVTLTDLAVGEVMLDTAAGDDVVQIQQVASQRDTWIFLGKGNDVLAAPTLTVGRNWRIKAPGAGSNAIVMGKLQVNGTTRLDLGRGADQVAFIDQTRFGGAFQLKGGAGNDVITVNPTRGGGTATFQANVAMHLKKGNDSVAFDESVSIGGRLDIRGDRGMDQVSGTIVDQVANRRLSGIESRAPADFPARVNAVFATLTRAGIDTAIFSPAQPPVVTMSPGIVTYTENAPPLSVDASVTVTDADSDRLRSATVAIVAGFSSGQDMLAFTASAGITGTYNATTGILTLTGDATRAAWQQVLRSVTYQNSSDNPANVSRVIRITVNDGSLSGSAERTIQVVPVDDPGSLRLPAEFSNPAVPVQKSLGSTIDFFAQVTDPDNNDYMFLLDLESSGIPATAAQPTIDAASGRFLWTPNSTGTFTIRIIAVNGDGFADQESFVIQVT